VKDWKQKVSFKRQGKNFAVEVVGWDEMTRWNVYAYIYPGHCLFLEGGESMWECPFPLQGVSFFKKHIYDGKVTSRQWGNDYDHIWNEEWEPEYKERAAKKDAEELFEFLQTVSRPHCEAELEHPQRGEGEVEG